MEETPLDELVAEAIEQGKNEPNDDILDMFETLHERLVRAEGLVADEIARRGDDPSRRACAAQCCRASLY
ncbi:hypothetical protein [Bradyrhizobium sp. LA7.1]|uniref:hypothetical protein n=1 Tax=Bradyrhizobium sp. LA7.1 TaxID=3156324 RepID=UPI00339AC906